MLLSLWVSSICAVHGCFGKAEVATVRRADESGAGRHGRLLQIEGSTKVV